MMSSDLAGYGFGPWWPFSRLQERTLLATVPKAIGAYAIRRREPFQRVLGQSDLLYVGCATNAQGLNLRLRQYFHPGPTQRTNRRILEVIGTSGDFEVAVAVSESIAAARALEATLLERYERDHGELPPENRRR